MEPAKKRACLDNCAAKYANMEFSQKKALRIEKADKYRLIEPTKRRKMSFQNAEKYRLMEPNKKQEIEITSWKARAYGIFTRVGEVSEIERVSAANE